MHWLVHHGTVEQKADACMSGHELACVAPSQLIPLGLRLSWAVGLLACSLAYVFVPACFRL
jgi:hypothetical protein